MPGATGVSPARTIKVYANSPAGRGTPKKLKTKFDGVEVLLAADAFNTHAQSIEALAGGNEQHVPVLSAEANISGPRFRNFHVLEPLSLSIKYQDAIASQVYVTLVIDRHSIGAWFTEQLFVCQ